MLDIIAELRKGVVIVGAPGMWQLVQSDFLSREELMEPERCTTFTFKIDRREFKLHTNIWSLMLMGPESEPDGSRAFFILSRGHHDLWIGPHADNHNPNVIYRIYLNPNDRSGTIRLLNEDETAFLNKLFPVP